MQLLRLEVRNWVHHRYRECEFTRGLVAILGENGSGKSSLFGAIRWALTGENPNYGVKTDNISQYAKDGEHAYVCLEFEHNGHIAVVTRYLLPEKEQSLLTVDGTEAARGDKAVTAGVEKLLGVDAKFISRFIIVSQTEIFSFIDDNQTETDKFFQRLFNTAKADKCQDAIGKAVSKITVPEILRTAAELAPQIEDIEQQIAAVSAEIAPLPTLEAFIAAQQTENATLHRWVQHKKDRDELANLLTQETEMAGLLSTAEQNCQQYDDDLDALTEAANGQEEAYAAARTALGHWQSYKAIAKSREDIKTQRQAVDAARAKDPAPSPPGEISAAELSKDLSAKDARIRDIKEFIRMFDEHGVAECPTCYTPSSKLAAQVESHKEELSALTDDVAGLTAAWNRQQLLEIAWRDWENREKQRVQQEHKLDAAEQSLQTVPAPQATEDDLQKAVVDYEQFQQARQEILPIAQQHREYKAKLLGAIENLHKRKSELAKTMAACTVTELDTHNAEQRLQQLQKDCAVRQALEQQKTQLSFDLQKLQEQQRTAAQQEAEAVKLRGWLHIAESAREALKTAPRVVAQRNLQKLEAAINELLQIFSVNFVVRAASDGTPTFVAEFFDGRKQPAQRLSIGQKTVLALAFRVAVNAMFAEDIGLLALDEPTAALDAPRIQALAPVLEKLRELSTAKGLQCLLVTHASNLSHLFESTILLEAPELRHALNNG
jgi:DNA repair exonuclease SbcCD ATPase subunit